MEDDYYHYCYTTTTTPDRDSLYMYDGERNNTFPILYCIYCVMGHRAMPVTAAAPVH